MVADKIALHYHVNGYYLFTVLHKYSSITS